MQKLQRRYIFAILTGLLVAWMPGAASNALAGAWPVKENTNKINKLCRTAIGRVESDAGIPAGLMQAISLVESGRRNAADSEIFAWPWAVQAEGRGRYYPSKDAAIKAVRALQKKGIGNIDVGCMQVNLHYHGSAFRDLEEAFDPTANAKYAARFLKRLFKDNGSWPVAVGNYHSGTPKLNRPYKAKVYQAWRETTQGWRTAALRSNPGAVPIKTRFRRPLITKPFPLARARKIPRPGLTNLASAPDPLPGDTLRPLQAPRSSFNRLNRVRRPVNLNRMTARRPQSPRKYVQNGAEPKTYRRQTTGNPTGR